jgi:chemotaxis protein MotA
MDIMTLVGTLIACGLLTYSMATGAGGLALFIDIPSVLIVFGGTLGVFLMNFTIPDVRAIAFVFLRTVLFKLPSPTEEIARVVQYATLARKEGLLALESKLKEVDDKFFAKGVQLVIDGFPPDTVRDIMELENEFQKQRHATGKKMLDQIGAYAPAFGMIGTLIGLVQMLMALDDPSKIGGGMAVALLTTLYGALIANVICIPLSGKLELRAKEEGALRELMIEGISAIQAGDGPQIIKEKLKSFLPPRERSALEA